MAERAGATIRASHQSWDTARFEARAPSRDECLAEAVAALVAGFADTTSAAVTAVTRIWIEPADDDDELALLLSEIIRLLTTEAAVPVDLEVNEPQSGGLDVRLSITPLRDVRLTGSLPREVLLPDVSLRRWGGQWLATFAVAA